MKVYISGPMSGIRDANHEAFDEAAAGLRALSYDVVSPAEIDRQLTPPLRETLTWGDYIGRDLEIIREGHFDAIFVLEGWENSDGAQLEVALGRKLGVEILTWPDWQYVHPSGEEQDTSAAIPIPDGGLGPLLRAAPLVHGDRQHAYGHPIEDFTRTAGIWSAMFGWKVEPQDIPLAMIAVKLSRLRQSPDHGDSQTDIAGYIETYHMTRERMCRT